MRISVELKKYITEIMLLDPLLSTTTHNINEISLMIQCAKAKWRGKNIWNSSFGHIN